MKSFAHSNGSDVAKWQTLQDHSKAVAALSESRVIGTETDLSHVSYLPSRTACVPTDDVALAREGQSLVSHLEDVGSLAQRFAAPFGLGRIAYVCGVLHDLGKYSQAFKKYLNEVLSGKPVTRGEVSHAWEGALAILSAIGKDPATVGLADMLANVVASHHGGLTDFLSLSRLRALKNTALSFQTLYDTLQFRMNFGSASNVPFDVL